MFLLLYGIVEEVYKTSIVFQLFRVLGSFSCVRVIIALWAYNHISHIELPVTDTNTFCETFDAKF